jgi:hypothetical protein
VHPPQPSGPFLAVPLPITRSQPQAKPSGPGQPPCKRFLDAQGYYVSQSAFTGPFIPVEAIRLGYSAPLSGANLFCVKKAMRDAVEAGALKGRRLAAAAGGSGAEAESEADTIWADWLRRAAVTAAA